VKLRIFVIVVLMLSLAPSAISYADQYLPYMPVSYGLPPSIGGYQILGVKNSDYVACMMPHSLRVLLQTSDPDLDTYLKNSHLVEVYDVLNQIRKSDWEIEIIGPGTWNIEQYIA
jgi:hypothetical protein